MARIRSQPTSIVVKAGGGLTGLDFPGSTWTPAGDCRMTFYDPLPAYPATYIWECFPRKQKGFYTTFFWGPDGSANADGFYPDRTYYGAHPYPQPRREWNAFKEPPPLRLNDGHGWEIAVEGGDVVGTRVRYNRWFIQALRVKTLSTGRRYHEYFTDLVGSYWRPGREVCLPSLAGPKIAYESESFPDPPSPGLVWGGAPWVEARGNEIYNGVIRGIRIYKSYLGDADLLSEVCQPLSSASGLSSVWYWRMNTDPANLACDPFRGRVGAGPLPVWSTTRKATLWRGP
jgi:hypothetical protein